MKPNPVVMAFVAGACAVPRGAPPARQSFSATPNPPDLSHHRLVDEGETGPSRPELRPYMHQPPLVHIVGARSLVVFADGVMFIEEEPVGRTAGGDEYPAETPRFPEDVRYGRSVLTADRLSLLRGNLAKACPSLTRSQRWCSHAGYTRVTCNLDGVEFVGTDNCDGRGEGRQVFTVAREIVDTLAKGVHSSGHSAGEDWFSGTDIERTLIPIHWQKYAPPTGD
jgi:hypothetical protein